MLDIARKGKELPVEIVLQLDRDGNLIACLNGPIKVMVDRQIVHRAVARASHHYMRGEPYIGGFWDTLNQGFASVKKITSIPLVHAVISAIPYAGTALSAIDMAGAAVAYGNKAIARLPPRTVATVRAAANGDPRAMAALASLKRDARPQAIKAAQDVTLAMGVLADQENLQDFLSSNVIDSPAG